MKRVLLNSLSVMTLVAYLLATTGAVGTHHHHHGLINEPVAEFAPHAHCHHHAHHGKTGCAHHASDAAGRTCDSSHHHGPGETPHDDDCAVCKMLSAKLLPTPKVAVVVLTEAVAEVSEPRLDIFEAPSLGCPLSRGPPVRG